MGLGQGRSAGRDAGGRSGRLKSVPLPLWPGESGSGTVSPGQVEWVRAGSALGTQRAAGGSMWATSEVGLRLPDFGVGPHPLGDVHHLCVWVYTSDAGADQAAAARHLGRCLANSPDMAVVGQHCLLHQCHLIVLKQVRRSQDGRCLSRLAMLTHLWRASGNVHKIRSAYAEMHGEELAELCARTAPAVPLRGRWGAVHESEARVLKGTRERLQSVSTPQVR